MIRPLIAVVLLFVVWLIFFSSLKKKTASIISCCLIAVCLGVLFFEDANKTAKQGRIGLHQVASCGTWAKRTYISNYDIHSCLENNSDHAITRLSLQLSSKKCSNGVCEEVDSILRDVSVDLPARSKITLSNNLAFKNSAKLSVIDEKKLNWNTDIKQIWAKK